MDCLRSFSFLSSASESTGATEFKTWGVAPQNYWQYKSDNHLSTFNIRGFKSVNIHSVEVQGVVSTLFSSSENAIKVLEYVLSLSRWGIDSLRSFPIYKNEKTVDSKTNEGL